MSGLRYPYKDEYVQMLRNHLGSGKSFKSFSEIVGCSHSTIFNWTVQFPEFEAVRKEFAKKNKKSWM